MTPTAAVPAGRLTHRHGLRSPLLENLDRVKKMRQAQSNGENRVAEQDVSRQAETPTSFPGLQQPPFMAATAKYNSNYTMQSALVADFNGDGRPDVAALQANGSLNVYLTPAEGTIVDANTPSTSSPGYGSYYWFAVADMNHDGKPDIVARGASTAVVYVNDGTGKFTKNQRSLKDPARDEPTYWNAQVGDVTGDGIPDLVTIAVAYDFDYETFQSTNYFIEQVYPGKGDGTLGDAISTYEYAYKGWLQPVVLQLELADMNQDGKLDLVTVFAPNDSTTVRWSNLLVQMGHGDGNFDPILDNAADQTANSILHYNGIGNLVVDDLNSDGYPDVIYASNDGNKPGEIYIALNKGDGTLAQPVAVVNNVGSPFLDYVNVADVNNDGKADLLAYSEGSVAIYLGHGDGGFDSAAKSQYIVGNSYYLRAMPADLNGDGNVDLVDFDQKQNKLAILAGVGDGTFHAAIATAPKGEHNSNVGISAQGHLFTDGSTGYVAQDYTRMNADFFPDIYTAHTATSGNLQYTRAITADVVEASGVQFLQPFTADLNGDGLDDAIFASQGGISVAYSSGDGTLSEPQQLALGVQLGCSIAYSDAADLNGDGHPDLVVAYQGDSFCNAPGTMPAGFFTLLSQPDGSYHSTFTAYGAAIYQTKLIDFNGDGAKDLVLADDLIGIDYNTWLYIYHFNTFIVPGKGDGTFDFEKVVSVLPNYQVNDMVAGDFDNDGKQDLTLLSGGYLDESGEPASGYPGALLLRGHGDFTFDAPVAYDAGHTHGWGAYGDLDGDGYPELALVAVDSLTGEPASSMVLLKNSGHGSFSAAESYQYSYNGMAAAWNPFVTFSDVNGDGSNDVLLSSSSNTALYLNNGGVSLSLALSSTTITKGQSLTLTAKLASAAVGVAGPGGTVSFFSDGTLLESAPVKDGVATVATTELAAGTHTMTARYDGDAAHYTATASASVLVYAAPASFDLGPASGKLTVPEGGSGSVKMSLTANEAFSGAVTLTCAGAPTDSLCSVSPGTASLSANGTASVTVSVVAGHVATTAQLAHPSSSRIGGVAAALLLGFIGLPLARRKRRLLMTLLLPVALGILLVSGCGSDSSHKTQSSHATLTVTARSGDIVKTQVIDLTITNR